MHDAPEALSPEPEAPAAAPLLNYSSPLATDFPPGWTNIAIYGLDPALAGREWERRLLLTLALRIPLQVLVIAAFAWALRDARPRIMLPAIVSIACIFAASLTYNLLRARRRFYKQWPTYRLVMADQGILRTCLDFDDLQLPLDSIRQVREIRSGLMIVGPQKRLSIYVSRCTQDYTQIREKLTQIYPISTARGLIAGRIAASFFLTALLLAAFYWGMVTDIYWQQLSCLSVASAITAWSIWTTTRNPNAMRVQKQRAFVSLLLPGYLAMKIFFFHHFFR